MSPKLKDGDVLITKKVNEEILKVGDIITFKKNGINITHRITKIDEENGQKIYTTKGDNNTLEDSEKVKFEEIEGKSLVKIPFLGKIIKCIQNQTVFLIIILLYICIIYSIIFFVYSTITKKQYFSVFGISFFTMENNLMEEELNKNDLIIVKDNVRYNENLEVNDNIVYERNSQIKINKITKINQNNGKTEYVTKAIKNYHPESENVTNSQIIGKVIANIAVLGFLLKILQSKVMVFVFLLFLIIRLFYNKYQYKMKIERKKKKLKI